MTTFTGFHWHHWLNPKSGHKLSPCQPRVHKVTRCIVPWYAWWVCPVAGRGCQGPTTTCCCWGIAFSFFDTCNKHSHLMIFDGERSKECRVGPHVHWWNRYCGSKRVVKLVHFVSRCFLLDLLDWSLCFLDLVSAKHLNRPQYIWRRQRKHTLAAMSAAEYAPLPRPWECRKQFESKFNEIWSLSYKSLDLRTDSDDSGSLQV